MNPFKLMLSGSLHVTLQNALHLKKGILTQLLTSEGRWNSTWHWHLSTKAHSVFFNLFNKGQGVTIPSCQSQNYILLCCTGNCWQQVSFRVHRRCLKILPMVLSLQETYRNTNTNTQNDTSIIPLFLDKICSLHH